MRATDLHWLLDDVSLETERVWSELLRAWTPARSVPRATWRPLVDVIESREGLCVRCDLPGVSAEQVRVVLCGPFLAVEGRREPPAVGGEFRYLRKEIGVGPFALGVRLPFVPEQESARATFEGGCLVVCLRRPAQMATGPAVVLEIRL